MRPGGRSAKCMAMSRAWRITPTCSISPPREGSPKGSPRSEEHTSELQSHLNLVCRLLLEKKKKIHRRDAKHDELLDALAQNIRTRSIGEDDMANALTDSVRASYGHARSAKHTRP